MPAIARFYGIVIRMYFQQAEHEPPHIHAIYGDDMAAIAIRTGDLLEGKLPPKAIAMVREWVADNEKDLLLMWETQEYYSLPPLK